MITLPVLFTPLLLCISFPTPVYLSPSIPIYLPHLFPYLSSSLPQFPCLSLVSPISFISPPNISPHLPHIYIYI